MDAEDEKRELQEELTRLRKEATAAKITDPMDANRQRQQEIVRRLADLGVQLG